MSRVKMMTAAALVGLGIAGMAGSPAQAASGGGCRDTGVIRSCISYASGSVHSDFYLLGAPDSSRCRATLAIFVKGKQVKSASYSLTRTGRYGPISSSLTTLPASSGSAYTRVSLYTCSGALHHTADSPVQYYP